MLRFLKSFFGKHNAQEPQAPYKVETPADVAPVVTEVVASKPGPAAKKPTVRKPAAKKEAAPKKPAAIKAAPKPQGKKPTK